jgi:hypothetical protein
MAMAVNVSTTREPLYLFEYPNSWAIQLAVKVVTGVETAKPSPSPTLVRTSPTICLLRLLRHKTRFPFLGIFVYLCGEA